MTTVQSDVTAVQGDISASQEEGSTAAMTLGGGHEVDRCSMAQVSEVSFHLEVGAGGGE